MLLQQSRLHHKSIKPIVCKFCFTKSLEVCVLPADTGFHGKSWVELTVIWKQIGTKRAFSTWTGILIPLQVLKLVTSEIFLTLQVHLCQCLPESKECKDSLGTSSNELLNSMSVAQRCFDSRVQRSSSTYPSIMNSSA